MEYSSGAGAAGAVLGMSALRRDVAKALRDGEELLTVRPLRRPSRLSKLLRMPCLSIEPSGPELPKSLAFAVTGQRVLVFRCAGVADEVKEIIIDIPRDEIREIEAGGGRVAWAAQGRRYSVNLGGREADELAAAMRGA